MDNKLDTVPERVAYAIKTSGLSSTDIASKMGVRESTIWRWEKLKKSNFKEREVIELGHITGHNPYWILHKEQPVRADQKSDNDFNRIKDALAESNYTSTDRAEIVVRVARKLRSLGQELQVLAENLQKASDR